ncbi:MAG: PspC family transcriptional regulator, partial [Prevotellaceae bacterium]|nr:PspC family transcriptional regulator [Prevotellaceae bacterium]
MKKTLTVNLGGVVYNIDEDAYRLLDNYLRNLKHYFAKQGDADEIVTDIEQRISELFAEKL